MRNSGPARARAGAIHIHSAPFVVAMTNFLHGRRPPGFDTPVLLRVHIRRKSEDDFLAVGIRKRVLTPRVMQPLRARARDQPSVSPLLDLGHGNYGDA